MFKPNKRLMKWYEKYNKAHFDGSLPKGVAVGFDNEMNVNVHGLLLSLEDSDNTSHIHHEIHLALPEVNGKGQEVYLPSSWVLMTLLHEMAHLKVYPYSLHGKKFQEEMKRLAMRDAFKELW